MCLGKGVLRAINRIMLLFGFAAGVVMDSYGIPRPAVSNDTKNGGINTLKSIDPRKSLHVSKSTSQRDGLWDTLLMGEQTNGRIIGVFLVIKCCGFPLTSIATNGEKIYEK